jgi:hypothetical protein
MSAMTAQLAVFAAVAYWHAAGNTPVPRRLALARPSWSLLP